MEESNELMTTENNVSTEEESDSLGFGAGVIVGGGIALAAFGVFKLFKKLKAKSAKSKEDAKQGDENIIDGEGVDVTEEKKTEQAKGQTKGNKK